MKKLILVLVLLMPVSAWAQHAPTPMQGSSAYEGSHTFAGRGLMTFCVTWHTQAARWLMIFDQTTVPSNGAVTPKWCQPITTATTPADTGICFDWTTHPMQNTTGVTLVASTSASGCTTLTADGSNDYFDAQVLP